MNTALTAMKHILIVDDDAPTREGLAGLMEAAGHSVRMATNGMEALHQARAHRPDLILLDLSMPIMDGWAFRTQQMVDPALADIPVVVLSTCGESIRPEAALLGITTCLSKPSAGDGLLHLAGELFNMLDPAGGTHSRQCPVDRDRIL